MHEWSWKGDCTIRYGRNITVLLSLQHREWGFNGGMEWADAESEFYGQSLYGGEWSKEMKQWHDDHGKDHVNFSKAALSLKTDCLQCFLDSLHWVN